MKYAAFTLDLDLTDYVGGGVIGDEFEAAWPVFVSLCHEFPELRSTWFVRIDEQMGALYGSPDYIFKKHDEKIAWLKDHGHEIGWHFHSYRKSGSGWFQNPDAGDVALELERMYPIAREYDLEILRMGWAYHNNETMKMAASLGLGMDSSAFPRPRYLWDNRLRDWSTSALYPYFPSTRDYRVSGNPCYSLLEFPITTAVIPAAGDTDSDVVRYINPAYRHEIFCSAFERTLTNFVNMVCHPYEFLENDKQHTLISFQPETLRKNMKWLRDSGVALVTLSELAEVYFGE